MTVMSVGQFGKMSETMERAVRHRQQHRNSGRLKGCVEKELEADEKKKTEWEKEVSDLAKHQTAAEAAPTRACKKFRKISENASLVALMQVGRRSRS